MDPTGRYILTSRVRTGRSIRGFKLPPVIGFEERRKMEGLAVKGLMNLKNEFAGDYYPLNGSRSYPPKPEGIPLQRKSNLEQLVTFSKSPIQLFSSPPVWEDTGLMPEVFSTTTQRTSLFGLEKKII